MLGSCAGGAVRLSETGGPLVVCEGIETGRSLLCGLLDGPHNVLATLSTFGVKTLNLPKHPSELVIAPEPTLERLVKLYLTGQLSFGLFSDEVVVFLVVTQ